MNGFEISLEIPQTDLEEIERRIASLIDPFTAEDVEEVLVGVARIIGDEARANIDVMTQRHTGNLRRGVKVRRGKRRHRAFATSYAAMDRKKAPHAHLVEYGHEVVFGKGENQVRTGRFVRPIPYWRAAVSAKAQEAEQKLLEGVDRLLDRQINQ